MRNPCLGRATLRSPALAVLLTLTACRLPAIAADTPASTPASKTKTAQRIERDHPSFAAVVDQPNRPRVLLIGDSISMGYTLPVRELLRNKANVHRPAENCRSTRQTLERIDAYLGTGTWDVIHFNCGIHDLTLLDSTGKAASEKLGGKVQVPLDEYRRNLEQIVRRMKSTGATLIWGSSTPVQDSTAFRRPSDVVAYNAAADEIMKKHAIVVDDLFAAASQTKAGKPEWSDGVHFTALGYRRLAEKVAATIENAITKRQADDPKGAVPQSPPRSSAAPSEHLALAAKLLGAPHDVKAKLQEGAKRGLIEIAPVDLPVDPPGDCDHYGWPIATMTGSTIVVMHRRIPGHNPRGAGSFNEQMSYGVVLRSTNSGKTWSEPYDLRDCMKPEDRNRGGIVPLSHRAKFDPENKSTAGYKVHLHSIGATHDGAIVAINNHGVFRSEDAGQTWKHFSTALRDDTFPHQIVNLGPNLIDHAERGLLAFGNWFGDASNYNKFNNQFVVLSSADRGATWQVEEHNVGFSQYEPATLLYRDTFLMVTRDEQKKHTHVQMSWRPGEKPRMLPTNLIDPKYLDTVDFAFNPVTKRFEVVRSERYRMELWLWSMDPADWEQGNWRRECRLLACRGNFYSTADGFHPAGAVIDEKQGLQHIFIYAGHPNGPAGVFRITRTLDTPKLASFLNEESSQ